MALELEYSRAYPVSVGHAFDTVLPLPLTELFSQRYGAIAAIRAVTDQQWEWGTVGGHRTITLTDGTTMRETLTGVDRPSSFGYRISDVGGLMKTLVAEVEGEWRFEPAGTGVRITWAWTVQPRGRVGVVAGPVFARMWRGYARQAMDRLEDVLVP